MKSDVTNPDPSFDVYEFKLQPGDTIVLYTDGLLENKDKNGQVIKEKVIRWIWKVSARFSLKM
jgi:serine phosphatase RsbU (regulator of sigma subunit)